MRPPIMQIQCVLIFKVIFVLSTIVAVTDCCSSRILLLREHTLQIDVVQLVNQLQQPLNADGQPASAPDMARLLQVAPDLRFDDQLASIGMQDRTADSWSNDEEMTTTTTTTTATAVAAAPAATRTTITRMTSTTSAMDTLNSTTTMATGEPPPDDSTTPVAQAEAEAEAETKVKAEAESATETVAEVEAETEADAEADNKAAAEAVTETKTEAEEITEAEAENKAKAEAITEAEAEAEAEGEEVQTTTATSTTISSSSSSNPLKPAEDPNFTLPCSDEYLKYFCLNGGNCFRWGPTANSMSYCVCAVGFVGERCDSKTENGVYVPLRSTTPEPRLKTARIVFSFPMLILLSTIYVLFGAVFMLRNVSTQRRKQQQLQLHKQRFFVSC